MGRFLRMAFIYRLTPNATRPLRLSADSLPTATAFHRIPLAMAIYRLFRHLLTYGFNSLALQPADNGRYRIGYLPVRVVPLGELPSGHRYAEGYKRTDPVIRWGPYLYRSFSAFLMDALLWWWDREEGVGQRMVLSANIGCRDPRYHRLLRTDNITEDQGIAIDYRNDAGNLNVADSIDFRNVIVSGCRENETVAAHLWVAWGGIRLYTTEPSAAHRLQPLAVRFPTSLPLWRSVLLGCGLDNDVINRGRVVP